MNYETLKITLQQAEEIVLNNFAIQGTAKALPGEVDFNFRIKAISGEEYVLKISRPDEDIAYLDFQQQLLEYVAVKQPELVAPKVIKDRQGNTISEIIDTYGQERKVRLLSWISGRVWSSVNPQLDALRYSLGTACGNLTNALQGFDHPQAHRTFEWDIAQAQWTKEYQHLFTGEELTIIKTFYAQFEKQKETYEQLRKAIVHNDANDNNVIVTEALVKPTVKAAIDYGDAIYTQIINDVAISCAYTIMGHPDPLEAALPIVEGYHKHFALQEEELSHLYTAIAIRLVISVTKSAINKIKEPDNTYLLISEKPAWAVLKKWIQINSNYATYAFRHTCGYTPHPKQKNFEKWVETQQVSLATLFPTLKKERVHTIDFSMESTWLGNAAEYEDVVLTQFKIDRLQQQYPEAILAGGYLEARPFYTTDAYKIEGNSGYEYRTIHLGTDFWVPAGVPVHAPLSGTVIAVHNNKQHKDYGPTIILEHQYETDTFYSLYGHLSIESLTTVKVGQQITQGELIGYIGKPEENVGWNPHLHFQIMLDMLGNTIDFPGVATPKTQEIWQSICPNANLVFKTKGLEAVERSTNEALINYRKQHLGKSLSLQYKIPIKMVRGEGAYLMDQYGRKYLDTVNNVAHVGHEHPEVVKAGQQQMSLLNTNSRYLHENINALAKELIETLPPELNVLHFVNSGSEANELAIRMVKAATGQRDIIASEVGYHGNANMCIDISSYKFDGKGGQGAPEHTHIFPLPDAFRGKYRGENTGSLYANEVATCIKNIQVKGRNVGALIVEPIISCGGQIELPKGFLKEAYQHTRAAGGLCISDEVQVGCGRVGKTWWGFQLHDVIPDIVTIGKPLGNGHPLAAVACTQEVADKFANGMEYFNTFGGNPVSCAIGTAVLQTVKKEKLKDNAEAVGTYLKDALQKLAQEYPIIGDVRGEGLFLGIELVDETLTPLAEAADYLANRMKDHGILMSTDGPDHNVLKIKPPIVFNLENAQELITRLTKIFNEDLMKAMTKKKKPILDICS
ncbi:aminotransferase class III-fold pyridoxal phosphate-dependent enzyme [Aquimarina rhabdastrellae]